jgi:hypothetical protein
MLEQLYVQVSCQLPVSVNCGVSPELPIWELVKVAAPESGAAVFGDTLMDQSHSLFTVRLNTPVSV